MLLAYMINKKIMNLDESTSLEEISKLPIWQENEIILNSEPAGESNMNAVFRITTNLRSVILKQSKSFVRKYPQIQAPIERIFVEYKFLNLADTDSTLKKYSPKVLNFLPEEHLLITEDLGKGTDFSEIYLSEIELNLDVVKDLCEYLNALHKLEPMEFPDNSSMKALNHEHLFVFPFLIDNGFDLDTVQEGLQKLSLKYKNDQVLKRKIVEIGKKYLSQGETLLHGDFYPGSWLKTQNGLKIIDPEFGFQGDSEFDLGVLFAHLDLSQQDENFKHKILQEYHQPISPNLLNQYQGVEILRRLIGIAQLPLSLTLEEKEELMDKAVELILN